MKVWDWLKVEANRAYVYNVLLALTPLVVGYGWVTETEWANLVGVVMAVLGLGLARANVTTKQ